MRQLARLSLLTVAALLALSGPAVAGCPDGDDAACASAAPAMTTPSGGDADLPYVDEITAPPVGTALTFGDSN